MSTEDNKALVEHIYTEVSLGNPAPLHAAMADDIVWTISGTTPLSGTFRGVQEVQEKLFAGLRAAVDGPVAFTFERFVAEGDWVVMEARGRARGANGRPYENHYCVVIEIIDGKLTQITDYIDTDLVNSALFAAEVQAGAGAAA